MFYANDGNSVQLCFAYVQKADGGFHRRFHFDDLTLKRFTYFRAKKYGDTADECGEAFFWCGKALLDLAR